MMATVLLIDDALGLRAWACLLKAAGYHVLTAEMAIAGIDLASEHHVGAVVLDYRLPELETLRELRAIDPTLPVIVLSGILALPDELKTAASAVVVKSEGAQRLLDAVAQTLRPLS